MLACRETSCAVNTPKRILTVTRRGEQGVGYKAGEPDAVFGFRWWVAEKGYRWVKARFLELPSSTTYSSRPVWLLTVGGRGMWERYNPLRDHPALFREFAALEPTRKTILTFASRYGLLGHSVGFSLGQRLSDGEPWSFWRTEITAMREAVRFWSLVQERDMAVLRRFIRWEEDHLVYRDPDRPGRYVLIASPQYEPEILAECRKSDPGWPATIYVQRLINKHLVDRVSPRLLRKQKARRLGLYFAPRTLLGAMWLQLARAVDGNKEYRRCQRDGCEKLFEVSLDNTGSRADRRYSSPACRAWVYRHRKKARQLAAQGVPLPEVARKFGTDVETVKGWVGKRGKRRGK